MVFHPKDDSGFLFDVIKGEKVPIPKHGVHFLGSGEEEGVFRVSDVRFDLAPFTKEYLSKYGLAPE